MNEKRQEIIQRMRREAHDALDEKLDQRERWHYPLVVTVTVEAPVVRDLVKEGGDGS